MVCSKYMFIDADTCGNILLDPVASIKVILDVDVVLLISCNLQANLGESNPVSTLISSLVT